MPTYKILCELDKSKVKGTTEIKARSEKHAREKISNQFVFFTNKETQSNEIDTFNILEISELPK